MTGVAGMAPQASRRDVLRQALALALGAAVSLGLARFSYALLLGPMRDDLGWSYFTAGAMNTANAAGYLLGALLAPRWIARHGPKSALVAVAWPPPCCWRCTPACAPTRCWPACACCVAWPAPPRLWPAAC